MKKTNRTLSALSGLTIILIVIGHSKGLLPGAFEALADQNRTYGKFLSFIYWFEIFHIPTFFTLSGFLFYGSNKISFLALIKKKFIRLLLPYLFISTLVYPLKAILNQFAAFPVSVSFSGYLYTLYMPWYNSITFFWFLPTLFLIFLFADVFIKYDQSIVYDLMLIAGSVLLWFAFPHNSGTSVLGILNISGVLHNTIFFMGGFLSCKYKWYNNKFANILGILSGLISIVLYRNFLNNETAYFLTAILGVFFLFGLASSIPKGFLSRVGDYSYQIYIFSWFPQVAFRILLSQILHVNIWIVVIACFVSGLFFPIFLTRFLNSTLPESAKKLYGIY